MGKKSRRRDRTRRQDPFSHFDDGQSAQKVEREKARDLRASQWWKRCLAKGLCEYCGQSVAPSELTMDHLIPVSRGGKTTKGNVVPACKECNNKKKHLLPMEWDQYLEAVTREDKE